MKKMKKTKRSILLMLALSAMLAFGCVGLCGCGGGDSGGSGDVTEWSFYSPYGPEDSACCEIWTKLFKQIEEETNGQLVITTYWSGQHPYEGSDMLKVVSDGTAQLAHFYGGYVSSVDPALSLDTLPLLFPADSDKAWDINSELWGNFEQDTNGLLEKRLEEKWNASMIHMLPACSQRLETCGYEAIEEGSLQGHKVRAYSNEFSKFIEALGGTPVSLESSEVYTALSTNLIDGVTTGVYFANSGGYFDYCDTINLWEISQSSDGLMVNLDALNALPEDVKTTFLTIMKESAQKPETLELEQTEEIVSQLEADGVKVVKPSDETRAAIAEKLQTTLWDSWEESAGELGTELINFVNSKR